MHSAFTDVDGVAFEGGGALGLAYPTILDELDLHGCAKNLRHFAGASAGAITAASFALGASGSYLRQVWQRTDFEKVFGGGASALRFIRRGGSRPTTRMRQWISDLVYGLGADPTIRMKDLPGHCGKSLVVTVTDEDSRSSISIDTRSEMTVVDAVTASAAIPIYFEPHVVNGRRLSDGGLSSNLPIVELGLEPHRVIGFRLDSSAELKGIAPPAVGLAVIRRIKALLHAVRDASNQRHVPEEFHRRIVRINTGNFSATDWSLANNKSAINVLEANARAALRNWMNRAGLPQWQTTFD